MPSPTKGSERDNGYTATTPRQTVEVNHDGRDNTIDQDQNSMAEMETHVRLPLNVATHKGQLLELEWS